MEAMERTGMPTDEPRKFPRFAHGSAMNFARLFPSDVLGWRLAGFSNQEIVGFLASMGIVSTPNGVSKMLRVAWTSASFSEAQDIARGLMEARRRRLGGVVLGHIEATSTVAPNTGIDRQASLAVATPAGRFSGASVASTTDMAPESADSRPVARSPEVSPQVARPSPTTYSRPAAPRQAEVVEPTLVPIAGEEHDFDHVATNPPQSFAALRRGLWEARKSSSINTVRFPDGQRVDIPSRLHGLIFSGKIATWEQMFERI